MWFRSSRVALCVVCSVIIGLLLAITLSASGDLGLGSPVGARSPAPESNLQTGDHRVVSVPPSMDRNGNRIADALERKYRRERRAGLQAPASPAAADLLIALDHPPTDADLVRYRAMGAASSGGILEAWNDPLYLIRARFPAAKLSPAALEQLGNVPGVVWVEENGIARLTGYLATRQTQARAAWAAGFEGNPNHSVAIVDSGIDHPDVNARLAAWIDFAGVDALVAGDEYPAPSDKLGHGTAMAGLAAGSGAAAGLVTGVGPLDVTFPAPLTPALRSVGSYPIDTTRATGASPLRARLRWQAALPNVFHAVQIFQDTPFGPFPLVNGGTVATAVQPLVMGVDNIPAGIFSPYSPALVGTSTDLRLAGWLQISAPMSAAADGRALMRGVAPGCRIVGVRVADDRGVITVSTLMQAISWLNANRRQFNIVCANASFIAEPSPVLDTAVNLVAQNGMVWVNAAGNTRESEREQEQAGQSPGIGSPASATKGIAVVAVNEMDRITNYSGYGRAGQGKPDLAAPSTSLLTGRRLIAPDSNSADADENGLPIALDQFPNDYTALGASTSGAAAQVAGAVMLVAQAMGEWSFTEAQVLRVKAILQMTASETGVRAEPPQRDPAGQTLPLAPDPELNRGDKDRVEGYGSLRVDAAVEAVAQSLPLGAPAVATLGPGPVDKKVWARNVTLTGGTAYTLALTNPPDADYDLYVYTDTPVTVGASEGEPSIAARSTRAALGGSEIATFTPPATGRYYVVVKFVAGAGGAFQVVAAATPDFALSVAPGTQALEVKGESVRYQVSVAGAGGFNTPVTLAVTDGLPAGVVAQFTPPTVNPGESSVLTLTTSAATPSTGHVLTIQGTAGTTVRRVTARLEVGAIWPRFHHDGRSSGRSPFNGPQSARQFWRYALGAPSASSPAIAGDGTIYVGSRNGRLHAVRPVEGAARWVFAIPSGAAIDSSPTIGLDGTIYVGADDGRLYALRPDGSLKWQFQLGTAPARTGPVIGTDGTIYVATGGLLHAMRPDGTRKWTFTGAGGENGSPALGPDGTIYFGTRSATNAAGNRLYAVRDTGTTAERKWEFEALGGVLSSPVVASNGRIYFGANGDSAGGRFYVVSDDRTSATRIAAVTTSGPVRSSAAVGPDGSVYVGDDANTRYAFAPDGRLKHSEVLSGQVVAAPAIGADGFIYMATRANDIQVSTDTGSSFQPVWFFFTGGEIQSSPAIGANGTLYVASFDGFLYGFGDAAPGGFSATINPVQQTALLGTAVSYTVNVQRLNVGGGQINLEVLGTPPAGVTAAFDRPQLNPPTGGGSGAILNLTSTSATPAGEFQFRVRGTSTAGAIYETALASLKLVDYAIAAEPAEQTVTAGQSITFTVAPVLNPRDSSAAGTIDLTAVIASGPTGGVAPTFAFDTSSIAPAERAMLTVKTAAGTPPGAYTVQIRGISGAVTRTGIVKVTVKAP